MFVIVGEKPTDIVMSLGDIFAYIFVILYGHTRLSQSVQSIHYYITIYYLTVM